MFTIINRRRAIGLAATALLYPRELFAMTRSRPTTEYLAVHGAFSYPDMDIGAKEIDRWHRERGFLQIGYHAVIRRDGIIEEGRPEHLIGAGVYGFNETTWHVCLAGGKAEEGGWEANYTRNQYDTLRVLLNQKLAQYPGATVLGHSDFPRSNKRCPGFNVKEWFS